MSDTVTFHFEGALADNNELNFYESARFQYAAARLMVKLAQFRQRGKFVKKITNKSNYDIRLKTFSDGSFNIDVEDPGQKKDSDDFVQISLADLIAYVSERLIEKIDKKGLREIVSAGEAFADTDAEENAIDKFFAGAVADESIIEKIPENLRDTAKRRIAEQVREQCLADNAESIARIDFARSQKLIAMSAPLVSEMATAFRKSANTLEITSSSAGRKRSVLFLNQSMAEEIETAIVDEEITPLLGDVTQFNKENGFGKFKTTYARNSGPKILSFSIPYDILPKIRQNLIDSMKKDQVYLQTYFVRDRSKEPTRLIGVGILPTPER